MTSRALPAIAGWLAAAATATAIGLATTGAIGTNITGATTTPLTPQQVDHALTRTSPAPSHQPGAPGPAPGGITRVLDTPGGPVIAHCHAGQATLISWSPAQGYDSEKIDPGPAPAAAITFEAANTETRVRVDCPAGIPTAHTTTGPDADQDSD